MVRRLLEDTLTTAKLAEMTKGFGWVLKLLRTNSTESVEFRDSVKNDDSGVLEDWEWGLVGGGIFLVFAVIGGVLVNRGKDTNGYQALDLDLRF